MTLPWWTILHVWTAVVVAPAGAAEPLEPLALPLPQTSDYAYELVQTVGQTSFSTDPRVAKNPRVLKSINTPLEIFFRAQRQCAAENQSTPFIIEVKNTGQISVTNGQLQVRLPPNTVFLHSIFLIKANK